MFLFFPALVYVFICENNTGDVNELVSLDSRLQQRYAYSPPDPDVTWSLGSAVAAYYDEMFYRAKIVGFDDDGIEVLVLQIPFHTLAHTGLTAIIGVLPAAAAM